MRMGDNTENKCQECGRKGYKHYCKLCNSVHFRDNFAHWTSGDSNLDKLIQTLFHHSMTSDEAYYVGEMVRGVDSAIAGKVIRISFLTLYKSDWRSCSYSCLIMD